MASAFLDDLAARGLCHQMSDTGLGEALSAGSVTGYIGFDPSAASLHVGSLLQVLALVRLQRAGHRPLAVVGGGTGLIGDPSGKESERSMLSAETLAENLAGMRAQLERFLDFTGPRGALVVDNGAWLRDLSLVDFLRDVGKGFSIGKMVARDSVKLRLEREQGISFTEFSYALLQAYDYLVLHERHGCTLQMGGSDQWGNIVDGCDLIRRKHGVVAHALTFPLITKPDGSKFGKSEQGNVWLAPELTSPYAFYQFWINAEDAQVVRLLKFFTLLPLGRIDELSREVESAPERREAQRVLAAEVTRTVHGDAALARAEHATRVLFGGDWRELSADELAEAFAGSPTSDLPRAALGTPEASLVAVLAATGLCSSRGRAREDVKSGAVSVNDRKVDSPDHVLGEQDVIAGGHIVLRRGKKTYHVVRVR